MPQYADLHLHSKWSIATSRDLDLQQISIAARKKGISLVGTGDFTHPAWLQELKEGLCPAEEGLFQLRPELDRRIKPVIPSPCHNSIRFVLQAEVSTIYVKNDRTRKIHHLIFVPDFASAERLVCRLSSFGTLSSDGRPTLRMDAKLLLQIVLDVHPLAFLVPAHIWTPWFSVLGSKTQFHSIDECYEELSSHIFAVETGLSSDPPMNRRVSSLDRFQLISNSDAHSPLKIGRKASKFSDIHSFSFIRNALSTGEGFEGTLEMYPEEGKYFLDGHRACGFSCSPEETHVHQGRCPHCHKLLTKGVVHRLETLADRPPSMLPSWSKPCSYAIPLTEVLSEVLHVGPQTNKVHNAYEHAISCLGPEIPILVNVPLEEIQSIGIPRLSEAIHRMRHGIIWKQPGFDGQYGKIRLLPSE
jgi:DNA helicase-2/ATP-dependent DNA helicase PcrA